MKNRYRNSEALGNGGRSLFHALFGTLLLTLGVLTWYQSGMYRDVETLWETTISRNPRAAMAHNNLGMLLYQRGQVIEAMDRFSMAAALEPRNPEAHSNLGVAFRRTQRLHEAVYHFRIAVEIKPSVAIYHANLGSALAEMGEMREAVVYLETAAEMEPLDAVIANNLARILATSSDPAFQDGVKAVELAERAVALSQNLDAIAPVSFLTLAMAYAATERFEEAVAASERAMALARADGNMSVAEQAAAMLEAYRSGRPYDGN